MRSRVFASLALSAALVASACGDDTLGVAHWDEVVDTVTLYTVDRPEYQGLVSAYDMVNGVPKRVEDRGVTGVWDFALTGGDGSPLGLTPTGALLDVASTAGLSARDPMPFDSLRVAPRDSADYVRDAAVEVATGDLFALRSRVTFVGGSSCVHFGKLEVLEVDQAEGTLTFRAMANPLCNDRKLYPPED